MPTSHPGPQSPLTTRLFQGFPKRFSITALVLASALLVAGLVQAQADPGAVLQGQGKSGPGIMVGELSEIPSPTLNAKAWLTLDANSGQVISAQNPHDPIEPASLTKIMSAYIVFEALENSRLKLDQMVHVSENAWKTEGSRMFIDPNTEVSVNDLLQGMVIQSGNDASVALAEAVAGSESAFVALMNQQARAMGLDNTHYMNSTGLPHPEHLTTAYDLAILSRAMVQRFPQYMHYYSQKEYTWNDIRQTNRNRLLWSDQTVDGLKTGHTQSAGYCLVTTALRDGRRVISVLLGSSSEASRAENSLKLLNWSFQNFDTVMLLDKGQSAISARVWEGESDTVDLGVAEAVWLTVPRNRRGDIQTEARYSQPLMAPLEQGEHAGTLVVSLNGEVLAQAPLQVLQTVNQAGIFSRLFDKLRLMFN